MKQAHEAATKHSRVNKRGQVQEGSSRRAVLGTTPLCPDDPKHGRLLIWNGRKPYFCPHINHGGNGKFFTIPEVS